jgi:bifunctional non-homologous end joining protein LigD
MTVTVASTSVSRPDVVAPMLAAPGDLPRGPGWAFEFKHDGARAIAYCGRDGVRVLSRNQNDVTRSYPELGELGDRLGGRRAVLDGEIVALDEADRPSFARLQRRLHVAGPPAALLAAVPVLYYVFDVLQLDGADVTQEPYAARRDLLGALELRGRHVRVPAHFVDVEGAAVLHAAEVALLEGVVAKRLAGPYRAGRRSPDWTKVPLGRTQEVLVVGWKPGAGRRAGSIGSLLVAVRDERDGLVFAGHVGTGFTDAALDRLRHELVVLARETPPVAGVPREHARHARWVAPVLVGEVAFRNWTPDGRLRHPSWRGLRPDREPDSARRPPPALAPGVVEGAMQTRDGRWRVEIVRRGRDRCYRLIQDGTALDGLAIATVERLLTEAGCDLADLVDAPPARRPGEEPQVRSRRGRARPP